MQPRWYDTIYRPAVEAMKPEGLADVFSDGRAECGTAAAAPLARLWRETVARKVGRTRMRVVSVCLAVAAVATPSASAAVELKASMTPHVIRFPGTSSIEYRLRIETGAQAERLRVQLSAPLWAGGLADGSPVRLAAPPTLDGAGTLEDFREAGSSSVGDECVRGYRVTWGMAVLALPPETVSTLVARYDTGRAAPWRGTDYRVRFVVGGIAGGPQRVDVLPPRPTVRGKTGVRFRLRFVPAQPKGGQRVRIIGRTYPALAGETIRIGAARTAYIAPGHEFFEGPSFPESFGRPWRLGTARVDRAGRFSLPGFVASARRFYAVWARYRTTRRGLVSDRSCEAMVWVDS